MEEEGLEKTENDLIYIGKPVEFDKTEFIEELKELLQLAYNNEEACREKVLKMGGAIK